MTQSVNAAIYRETGNSPRSFDLARYRNSQWTSNLDLGGNSNCFLAAPLALSLGCGMPAESYRIDAGDPASYYSGGAESLAGLSPLSEGQWSRHAWASYLDLGTSPDPSLGRSTWRCATRNSATSAAPPTASSPPVTSSIRGWRCAPA